MNPWIIALYLHKRKILLRCFKSRRCFGRLLSGWTGASSNRQRRKLQFGVVFANLLSIRTLEKPSRGMKDGPRVFTFGPELKGSYEKCIGKLNSQNL